MTVQLAFVSLLVGLVLAVLFASGEMSRRIAIKWPTTAFVTIVRGLPEILVVLFIYFGSTQVLFMITGDFIEGPGQFDWIRESFLWTWLSQPWFCAMLALALNTAAYSTLLFRGAFNAIPAGQWEACRALGMDKVATLKVLLPYALRRAVPAYSNEVILVFKGTSLASTITIMDLMGYAQRINGQTYDTLTVFGIAGAFYLAVNGVLTLIFRQVEKKA
ncbi:UNVERIFIED_CONTAM: hypothetical protein GTU68_016580, partial [Idotea baltica]|nr:hypothetical protein [Idotea baltica]